MELCKVCKEIPFDILPSEEQPAVPYHKRLGELEDSAKKCNFCLLILYAAGELSMILKNIRDENSNANPGVWVTLTPKHTLPSGCEVSFTVIEGYKMAGGWTIALDYKGPIYLNPREMFLDGRNIRT